MNKEEEMKDIDQKYRKDCLSKEELLAWREKVNAMPDEDLAQTMRQAWMDEDFDTSAISDAQLDRLKGRIDAQIEEAHPKVTWRNLSLTQRVLSMAAAILLPVFAILTFYFYQENVRTTSDEMIVSTGVGERANITLPDGTTVTLNAESALTYQPNRFNKEERQIHFDGEGYFQVARNEDCPFRIDATGLKVEVLGTTFNLDAHREAATAELSLEEGSVSFLSTKTGESVIVEPNQQVILNQKDGLLTVIKPENIQYASAWKRGEISFENIPFEEVIQTMEENYHVDIEIDSALQNLDLFTGTLPVTDLHEALLIIGKVYGLNAHIDGNRITLSAAF